MIHPAHRGRGHGTALARALLAEADGHAAAAVGARRPAGRRAAGAGRGLRADPRAVADATGSLLGRRSRSPRSRRRDGPDLRPGPGRGRLAGAERAGLRPASRAGRAGPGRTWTCASGSRGSTRRASSWPSAGRRAWPASTGPRCTPPSRRPARAGHRVGEVYVVGVDPGRAGQRARPGAHPGRDCATCGVGAGPRSCSTWTRTTPPRSGCTNRLGFTRATDVMYRRGTT